MKINSSSVNIKLFRTEVCVASFKLAKQTSLVVAQMYSVVQLMSYTSFMYMCYICVYMYICIFYSIKKSSICWALVSQPFKNLKTIFTEWLLCTTWVLMFRAAGFLLKSWPLRLLTTYLSPALPFHIYCSSHYQCRPRTNGN